VSPRLWELLDFAARWVHVIAGIMWIGTSLLFNWIDRTLQPSSRGGPGLLGESWLLHSGGFYFVEKTQLAGQALPRTVHWFKWQAYTTWLSGVSLLIVVYYVGGRASMADSTVAPLGHGAAVLVGITVILAGTAFYELVQRHLGARWPTLATTLLLAGFVGVVVALTHLLNGRAAFLHVGALLGTIMVANVAHTIIPSQRALVRTVTGVGGADPTISARAKRVSVTNNYVTFPVIALMVSSHFPSLYGGAQSWLVLLLLVACGVVVRHLMNVRFHRRSWKPALAGTVVLSFAALYAAVALPERPPAAVVVRGPVSFAQARHVIDRRCAACHSLSPSDSSFGAAPAGVAFDLPEQIRAHAARIRERAVVTRTMPPANRTHITEAERQLLGAWIDAGAVTP
jgi:uncharacterized membrane protein